MSNVKQSMDIFFDHRAPSIVTEIAEYRDGYIDIRKRGGRIRCFTEITKDNLRYCKELMKLVDEFRHLDGVRGGMAVSESEYMATTVLQEAKPLTQVIYSSVKEVVEQGQYIFDTLWNGAIPAQNRIREIEEGVAPPYTRVVSVPDDIIKEIIRINESSNELSICATAGGLQFTFKYLFELINKLLDRSKRGQHKGIRYLSNIDRDNVEIAKTLLDSGVQLKHIRNLPPLSFGVSDKEIGATIEKMEQGNLVQSILISNESVYVSHFKSIFEELWKNGVDAKSRIHDIEEGLDTEGIEIIQNPYEIQKLAFELAKLAQEEIRIIFSTANAFHRQESVGAIQLLKEAVAQRGVKVRILTPRDDLIEEKAQKLMEQHIDIRYIEPSSQTRVSFVVADDNSSLSVELKDDTKSTSYDAIGLATYSNSKPTVLSYISIFESLWKQADLYQLLEHSNEELAVANEKLKESDKIQKEFINVAAHELRTPIQPILGLSEVLQSKLKNKEEYKFIEVISRNAKRLHRLTEDILDVTKIESQSLQLQKEKLNLNNIIMSVLADYESEIRKIKDVKISLVNNEDFLVEADKGRLNQVISNLLSNAIKFTQKGSIVISCQIKDNDNNVIVFIKDTGMGIDQKIMSRLFTKFASKSFTGTGLGLFISKSIIEAHGGKIWAENNSNGKGATFSFSLPINQ
ncbi:MAG TPA: HAMP domain-containing sensor histidine kinase [Nitrososphaeraceae archaeon]|nr:HAMP domain-containing sensor histidine kinase [Nitrososphaeraceae archaeon]